MAFNVTRSTIKLNGTPATLTFTALSTSGKTVDFGGKDFKCVLLAKNSAESSGDITVMAGNGIQGIDNLTVTVPASGEVAFALNAGEFKAVKGTDKGSLTLKGASTLSVAIVEVL